MSSFDAPIGKLMSGVNFTDLFLTLDPSKLAKDGLVTKSLAQAKEAGAAVIACGSFINTVIDFTIDEQPEEEARCSGARHATGPHRGREAAGRDSRHPQGPF